MSQEDLVILVDDNDTPIGVEEKLTAHKQALLHRAFSVFVFYHTEGNEPELLLQQRQHDKYHCGSLWTNTCCSHPHPGEEVEEAAKRRLKEEMGIEVKLERVGGFRYKATFDNGLTENEMDHVLVGFTKDKTVPFNKAEVSAIAWMPLSAVLQDLLDNPKKYTPWLSPALEVALK